jgi:hypothetical protein
MNGVGKKQGFFCPAFSFIADWEGCDDPSLEKTPEVKAFWVKKKNEGG